METRTRRVSDFPVRRGQERRTDPFLHSSTFGASPLAGAAVLGSLRAMHDETVTRAAQLDPRILHTLRVAHRRRLGGPVREVRGRGLLLGIEYTSPGVAGDVAPELISRGVLVNHSLNASTVLRLTPPAVLTGTDLRFFADVLDDALTAVAERQTTGADHA